ncbi:MAG: hypothetical protein D6797_01700 [Bdellovibrio sp.]|nr:MAG: hypothetical protein D6797_01700 [Bdellovibrio sp.]
MPTSSPWPQQMSLFCFFAFIEEPIAQNASIALYKKIKAKIQTPSTEELIAILHQFYFQTLNRKIKLFSKSFYQHSAWQVPDSIDLSAWKQFKKEATPEEFLAVIFVHILKFSAQETSQALKISLGSLHYRLNKGLQKLSSLLSSQKRTEHEL